MKKLDWGKVVYWGMLAGMILLQAVPGFAGSGIEKIDTGLEKVSTAFKGAGVVVFAIALMWAGYSFFKKHESIEHCLRIFAGGALIGGASELAAWWMG